jgi:hypothetical protein
MCGERGELKQEKTFADLLNDGLNKICETFLYAHLILIEDLRG